MAKRSIWADYLELCKPRVVMMMLLTAIVGMCLSSPSGGISFSIFILANLGIGLVASAAAVLNHIADQQFDRLMRRTERRPIAEGRIPTSKSLIFATILCIIGMTILFCCVNKLTTILTFLSLIGYAVCYTLYLKHATPQNIVIGGIAGAAPPLLGWTAMTGHVTANALLLVLIIYVWTPPHFWALAIHRSDDYANARIPMLPNTHGLQFTRLCILLYTILLLIVTVFPYLSGMSGLIYLIGIIPANLIFFWYAWKLFLTKDKSWAMPTFRYSIIYLGIIFLLLLVDHYWVSVQVLSS